MKTDAHLLTLTLAFATAAACALTAIAAQDGTLLNRITGTDLTALPSPETSAPARHIDHSIDYSTGKASIAIPLHVYSTGRLSVPLVLRGQTGAVKVDEEPGNIGKGWELDCGGFVARSIVGMPDELHGIEFPYMPPGSGVTNDLDYLKSVTNYQTDSHLDRYTYMAGEYSGSFVYSGGQIVRLTDDDCSVEILAGGPTAGFIITTPEGTRYRYDIPEKQSYRLTSLVCSGIPSPPGYTDVPCMWRLSSITDRTGTDTVTFTYSGASDCGRSTGGKIYTETIKNSHGPGTSVSSQFVSSSNGQSQTTHRYEYTDRHILKKISGRAGEVVFSSATVHARNPIDYFTGFSVVSNTGRTVRNVTFTHDPRGSEEYNRDILLKGYEVTAGDTLLDAATFGYYHEGHISPRKDFYGYCNHGVSDFRIMYIGPGFDDVGIDPGITHPREPIDKIDGDYVGSGYKRVYVPVTTALHESIINVRNDTAMANPFRRPHPEGVFYGALHTIGHASGTLTEFGYEPATVPGATWGGDTASIGLRLVRETVTDLNTGSVRERSLSYGNAAASFDLKSLGYGHFISVSGSIASEKMSQFIAEYTTTGITLTTCSRVPGASPENAVAYHGKVTETLTGTGIDSPVVTVYEYDLSQVHGPEGQGGKMPAVNTPDAKKKYAGAESENSDKWETDGKIESHRILYGMRFIDSYEKDVTGPRAPLRRMTEYVFENGDTVPLRVTERFTSIVKRDVTVGYHCEPIVRNVKTQSGIKREYNFNSIYDFCHFPIKMETRRAYTDSVRVTEYDCTGNHRTVTSVHTYNNHGAAMADNGLPYRTVTSCGGQSVTTTRTYASTRGSGYEDRTDAIALPVSETVACGSSVTESRTVYSATRLGTSSSSGLTPTYLLPSSILTRHNGATVDSVSISSYDTRCNPTEASHNGDDPVTFGWDASGTLLTSVTAGNLTTTYTHEPLVGCTSVTSPGGTVRSFAYRGGRLWKESVAGTAVAEHAYGLFATDGVNSVTSRALTGAGTGPCTTVRSDAYGGPLAACLHTSPASGSGILTLTVRDALSRPLREYMPFEGAWAGETAIMETDALSAYPGDSAPYTAIVHEAAPAGRTLSVTLGGEAFAPYPARMRHMFNTAGTGALSCRRFSATASGGGSLRSSGLWPEGTLAVTVTTDPDGRETYVFTDFRGRRVLERRATGGTPAFADTHYVYDDAGCLVFILPPAASAALTASSATWNPATDATLRDHAYIYRYDACNRVVSRKTPGAEETLLWYDLTGSQVFSQDPLQRQRGVMSFSLADAAGRPAIGGECAYSASTVTQARTRRLRASLTQTWGEAFAGYGVPAMTLPGAVAHTAIYYDGYGFLQLQGFSALRSFLTSKGYTSSRANCAGLATGSYSRLLGAEGAVLSVSHLDSRDRTVRTVSSAMPSGFLVTETTYSNTDRPLSVTATHYRGGNAVNSLGIDRKYDAYDRESEMTVRLNGAAVTSTADTYAPNGRPVKTVFGNPRTQSVAYTYTTRGDIASITAPSFSQALTYSADSCRNGNIRTSSWKGKDGIQRSYCFSYDGLNRLTRALYTESGRSTQLPAQTRLEGIPDYTESMAYDLSSNPVRIRRKGITEVPANALTGRGYIRFGVCDDISLTYSGTKLVRADDAGAECRYTGATDFSDGVGNMVGRTQTRPSLSSVTPYSAGAQTMGAGDIIAPTWLVDTLSYCGPFEYRDGKLSRVNFPGGYISGDSACHYIRDHQGNVRQVVSAATGTVVQENCYYPGGTLFGESTSSFFRHGSATNAYRYGAKEFITHGGLHLALHGARMYDPALSRFITPDPLGHKTPQLSSYLYCAANPVMFTDPTGMRVSAIDNGNFSITISELLQNMRTNSFFDYIYQALDGSDKDFIFKTGKIEFEEIDCDGNSVTVNRLGKVGEILSENKYIITLDLSLGDQAMTYYTLGEEAYHGFQKIIPEITNLEFEAKTAALIGIMTLDVGGIFGDTGMSSMYGIILDCYSDNGNPTPPFHLEKMKDNYVLSGKTFLNAHKDNPDSNYQTDIQVVPERLINAITSSGITGDLK